MPEKIPSKPTSWRKVHKVLSWRAAGTDSLHSLVSGVCDCGNAVMFSNTIDGSALVLTVFSGDIKVKEYITEPGDLPPLFAWVLENFS